MNQNMCDQIFREQIETDLTDNDNITSISCSATAYRPLCGWYSNLTTECAAGNKGFLQDSSISRVAGPLEMPFSFEERKISGSFPFPFLISLGN